MYLLVFTANGILKANSIDTAAAATKASAPATVWLDATLDEVAPAPEAWRDSLLPLTGAPILDLHLLDVQNLTHPSYFDTTHRYDMVIFRKLLMPEQFDAPALPKKGNRTTLPALAKIDSQPVTFFVFDHLLITVHASPSRTIEQIRERLLASNAAAHAVQRTVPRAEELMLRLLNGMVDRYLDLRVPLTRQLDRWQRALLDPLRPFSHWQSLLDARIEIRKLEHLCEEQHDALQEFRDSVLENTITVLRVPPSESILQPDDALLVRIRDVMDHINRVLEHTRRLESSIESAVQIHFSAVAHRTNRTIQVLTVMTALFMPLTFITGIFGMNFEIMPWVHRPQGFWWAMALMASSWATLALVFYLKRYITRS